MLTILVRVADGHIERRPDLASLTGDLADPKRLVWVDAEAESSTSLARLADLFALHPVTLDDFVNRNQRPKVEEFEHYLFLVVHALRAVRGDVLESEELHVALLPRVIVSVHAGPLEAVTQLQHRLQSDPHSIPDGPSFLLYHLSDTVVDAVYPILDALGDEIDVLEDAVLASPTPAWMDRIFQTKRLLVQLRKVVSPQREVYNALSRRDHPYIDPHVAVYFRDVHDHLVRAYEVVDSYRDLVGNMLDAYLATVSNRLGQVMKQLTIIATIFMPLSFLTGFFGMNFQAIPFDRPWLFWAMLLLTAGVPAFMLGLFLRRGWIGEDRSASPRTPGR